MSGGPEPAAEPPILVQGVEPLVARGPTQILIVGGRIAALGPAAGAAAPTGVRRLDGSGLLAAPGFVELQVNGAAGHDLTADPSAIWAVGSALPRYGISAFLPTIVSAPLEVVERARQTLLAGPPDGYRGATALGLHIEGPFLSPARSGAHDIAALRDPDPAVVADWSSAGGVRVVTLAPELPGALELTRVLIGRGVVVSAGHSAATFEEARAGFDAGIAAVTHLFNAMPPFDHRRPGLVGAALADPRVTVGLIPDGLHVHPSVVAVVRAAVGTDRLAVVSDAIAGLGVAPGRYRLGTREVIVDDRSARLTDGGLAGSLLGLDEAVRNLRAFTGCGPADALAAVTRVPARLLGLDGERGSLTVGTVADVTLLDADLRVVATIVAGRLVHDRLEGGRWA